MKWLEDMSEKAKQIKSIWWVAASAAGIIIWLFATFTTASAFGDFKDTHDKKDLYQLRRTLRQDVEDCEQAKKKGPLSEFMRKACINIDEEYKMTVDEINARWGNK